MIYFDNSATTFPKPLSVAEEVFKCIRYYGGNPGRGAHPLSMRASEKVYECRTLLAEMFGTDDPSRVIFTANTTTSLNIVIKGLLHVGDHALISDIEHNAVWRPIMRLKNARLIDYSIFPTLPNDSDGRIDRIIEEIEKRILPSTKMLVCAHGSNICSLELPIKEIGKLCRRRGIYFIIDCAATAGHIPIDIKEIEADALCIPAHKGLYGPQGCGILILGQDIQPETLIEGGNGINSLGMDMSDILPERYEAGTLCTPAIAGLAEGIKEVNRLGIPAIREKEKELFRLLHEKLVEIPNIIIYADKWKGHTLLFNVNGIHPDEIGHRLALSNICVRSGYHCAPLAHKALHTFDGGAVRVSFGIFNTHKEISAFCDEIRRIGLDARK